MVSMKAKKNSGKERSDKTSYTQCTNSTTLENDIGASMTHVRPEVLYGKSRQGNIARLQAGFAACWSYAICLIGTECNKGQLTEMLKTFCDGILGTGSPWSSYKHLVNMLLIGVQTQWHNICIFINSFHVELAGVTAFNKDKAWKLVGQCVATKISCLQRYKYAVGRLEDMGTIEIKAGCIWFVLQCHCLGMSFDLVRYQGHPLVVEETIIFILSELVDSSEAELCFERAKKAENEASNSKNEVPKLKDVAASMNCEFKTL
jgi:hypothetical protein